MNVTRLHMINDGQDSFTHGTGFAHMEMPHLRMNDEHDSFTHGT